MSGSCCWRKSGRNSTVLRILSYIADNYRTATLSETASHFGYSVEHCSRLIRGETGTGFISFVRKIKMNHAAALPRSTRSSVADISSMVGYENPESFIRVFEKFYQMTPSAYRS